MKFPLRTKTFLSPIEWGATTFAREVIVPIGWEKEFTIEAYTIVYQGFRYNFPERHYIPRLFDDYINLEEYEARCDHSILGPYKGADVD